MSLREAALRGAEAIQPFNKLTAPSPPERLDRHGALRAPRDDKHSAANDQCFSSTDVLCAAAPDIIILSVHASAMAESTNTTWMMICHMTSLSL